MVGVDCRVACSEERPLDVMFGVFAESRAREGKRRSSARCAELLGEDRDRGTETTERAPTSFSSAGGLV